jgi:hypothetical protein
MSSGTLAQALQEVDVHLSPAALQRYAREGRLPARVTPGGHYRFDLTQVLEALGARAAIHQGSQRVSPVERLFEEHRDQIREIATRHHGRAIYVFGSVARGEERADSDIDFLVDFEAGSSLFDLMRISDELEALLGRSVDVVSRAGLKDRDSHILDEAIPV